ncbi:MAG: ion channel [Gammaproteobacteria bacterium]|jgi:hypothetical protein
MNYLSSFFGRSGRFIFLLGSLLGLLIASAFVEDGKVLFNVLLSLTLLSSVYAISHDRRFVVAGFIIALATFLCAWLAQLFASQMLGLISSFLGFVFFQFTAAVILVHIFKAPSITIDELLAAISTYLLLGIGGGFIFRFLELLDPNTLLGSTDVVVELSADSPMNLFIYYSFTCLTTLGFGDLIPGTPEARVFSYLSAVIGQIFLTVLIARFVGLHISQLRRDS